MIINIEVNNNNSILGELSLNYFIIFFFLNTSNIIYENLFKIYT